MQRLFDAPQSVLRGAIARAEGLSTFELELKLKKEKEKDKKSDLPDRRKTPGQSGALAPAEVTRRASAPLFPVVRLIPARASQQVTSGNSDFIPEGAQR